MANVLNAIKNIIENQEVNLDETYISNNSNRINSVGDALESYVKDMISGAFNLDEEEKGKKYDEVFSYLGNNSNPPDLMIRGGDAIEVKKIQGKKSSIALNSSLPKNKLLVTSSKLTEACRNSEEWKEKDMMYFIGRVPKDKKNLSSLWIVHGDCYAADESVYKKTWDRISDGIHALEGIDFTETKELAKVKKIDILENTDLRIRAMLHIKHPLNVFNYLDLEDKDTSFELNAIFLEDKYELLLNSTNESIISLKNLNIKRVEIKSPDQPNKMLKAVHLRYIR